jgi:flagellar biosynthesis protein FliR
MHIFALGLQLKLAVGFVILLATLPVISRVLDSSITNMFESISRGIEYMLTP